MTDEQREYIDLIGLTAEDEILVKESGWEVVDLPVHTHRMHQLIHTLSGTLHIEMGDMSYFVPQHHLAWIPPGAEHRLSSNNRQISLQVICCHGLHTPTDAFAVYNTNTIIGENLKFIGKSGTRFKRSQQPEMYDFIISFLNLFPVKGEEYRIPLKALFEPHDRRLREVLRYIDAHLDEDLSKEKLADKFGMSVRSLSRLFHNSDVRFTEYINYQRITRAIEMFADRDQTIEQIAYSVGFNSPNHFNRVFKQLMGKSPGYYYKRH